MVREASAVAPTAVLSDDSMASPEAPADLRVVIIAQDSEIAGVELHLHGAKSARIPFDRDIYPVADVRRTQVFLSLAEGSEWRMEGLALRWRFLERVEAEAVGRYGRTFPDDLEDLPVWEPRDRWDQPR
jgi:hypothetical protein